MRRLRLERRRETWAIPSTRAPSRDPRSQRASLTRSLTISRRERKKVRPDELTAVMAPESGCQPKALMLDGCIQNPHKIGLGVPKVFMAGHKGSCCLCRRQA